VIWLDVSRPRTIGGSEPARGARPMTVVQTYSPAPSVPRLALPAGACDAHVHVFGPRARFPFADGLRQVPADATKETLFALHRRLGVSRCVIVQSTVHGFDNAAIEDAIRAGGGAYLGVALAPVDVADAELRRLADAGFRAVRFNFMRHLPSAPIDAVIALTARLAPLGLHLQVHFEPSLIHELAGPLSRSAVPVVVDHMARVDARLGAGHADFAALEALMRDTRFHVKVSGIDRVDTTPPYAHGIALARRLVDAFADRCVWGTDWPHPNHTHVPDDGALVDALEAIAPDPAVRRRLLVDTPARLYRFEAGAPAAGSAS
jgi:2-pyrone-4,6-dicarboxylate lactonase